MTRWIFFIFPISLESHIGGKKRKERKKKLLNQSEPNSLHPSLCSGAISTSVMGIPQGAAHCSPLVWEWRGQLSDSAECLGQSGPWHELGESWQIRARLIILFYQGLSSSLAPPNSPRIPSFQLIDSGTVRAIWEPPHALTSFFSLVVKMRVELVRKNNYVKKMSLQKTSRLHISVPPTDQDGLVPFVETGPVNFLGRISHAKTTRKMFGLTFFPPPQCLWTLGSLGLKKALNLKCYIH